MVRQDLYDVEGWAVLMINTSMEVVLVKCKSRQQGNTEGSHEGAVGVTPRVM